jgi:hypothetical protein
MPQKDGKEEVQLSSRAREERILLPRRSEEFWDQEQGLIVRQTQDVEALLEENHADRTSGNNGYSAGRTLRRIGSVPNIVVDEFMRVTGINLFDGSQEAQKGWRKLLNEYPKFKTVDKI